MITQFEPLKIKVQTHSGLSRNCVRFFEAGLKIYYALPKDKQDDFAFRLARSWAAAASVPLFISEGERK